METLDYVYLNQLKLSELRKQFADIWRNEPHKVNAFISGEEFPLKTFKMCMLGKNGMIEFECNYSKNKKEFTFHDPDNGYTGYIKKARVVVEPFSNHLGNLQINCAIEYEDIHAKQKLLSSLKVQNKTVVDWLSDLLSWYLMINIVVATLPHKVSQKTEKANKVVEVKNKGKKTYKSVVYLKHCYYLDSSLKLSKSDIKHVIKCPAWGVRGHYRHLQDGRVIFVKPYIKGKYRNDGNKYVSKEYKLQE